MLVLHGTTVACRGMTLVVFNRGAQLETSICVVFLMVEGSRDGRILFWLPVSSAGSRSGLAETKVLSPNSSSVKPIRVLNKDIRWLGPFRIGYPCLLR